MVALALHPDNGTIVESRSYVMADGGCGILVTVTALSGQTPVPNKTVAFRVDAPATISGSTITTNAFGKAWCSVSSYEHCTRQVTATIKDDATGDIVLTSEPLMFCDGNFVYDANYQASGSWSFHNLSQKSECQHSVHYGALIKDPTDPTHPYCEWGSIYFDFADGLPDDSHVYLSAFSEAKAYPRYEWEESSVTGHIDATMEMYWTYVWVPVSGTTYPAPPGFFKQKQHRLEAVASSTTNATSSGSSSCISESEIGMIDNYSPGPPQPWYFYPKDFVQHHITGSPILSSLSISSDIQASTPDTAIPGGPPFPASSTSAASETAQVVPITSHIHIQDAPDV